MGVNTIELPAWLRPTTTRTLYLGDTFEVMASLEPASFDLILADLPYGTTRNKWDVVLPFGGLWHQYTRLIKPAGVVVLFGAGLFAAKLQLSHPSYRYKWIWEKNVATNFLNSKKQPLRSFEEICVFGDIEPPKFFEIFWDSEEICIFYKGSPTYNPQMWQGNPYKGDPYVRTRKSLPSDNYNHFENTVSTSGDGSRYPRDIIKFNTCFNEGRVWHPTQKPVKLGEYLIQTYTNEGDRILDNTMGVGSFGVAARNLNRGFVGIDNNPEFVQIAFERIFLGRLK